jgi:hypothetical protein
MQYDRRPLAAQRHVVPLEWRPAERELAVTDADDEVVVVHREIRRIRIEEDDRLLARDLELEPE